jgi:PPOX class probable F420-dependent enzyme
MAVLSKPRLNRFLKGSNLIATLATLDREGRPYLVPVWYEWDGTHLWVVSKPKAEYVENLRRNPQAAVSVATREIPYVRVYMQGPARLIKTGKDWLPMGRRMAARYLGRTQGRAYIAKSKDWTRIYIRIKPVRIVSWDGGATGHEWGKKYIQISSGASANNTNGKSVVAMRSRIAGSKTRRLSQVRTKRESSGGTR